MKTTRIFAFLLAFLLCLCVVPAYAAEADGKKNATLGDLNGNGEIDAADYMLLKRFVLGTFTLTAEQEAAADVNHDGSINAVDYMLVKRHVLGTYVIGEGAPVEATGFVLPTIMRIDNETVQFIFNGNVIEARSNNETVRIVIETDSKGNAVKATATMPDGSKEVAFTCSYTANGIWPTKIHNNLQETYASLQYNAKGNPVKINLGLDESVSDYTCSLEYNANGKLIKQTAPDASCTYQYDKNGRLQSVTYIEDSVLTYKYNADGTVVTGSAYDTPIVEYTYDKNGNITKIEYPVFDEVLEIKGYTSVTKAQYQCFWMIFEPLFENGAQRMPIAQFSPLV